MSNVTLKINGEKEFTTNHPLITFGRTADNTVPLDDTNVSRYHARIEQREDGYWIVDQGSSNGTTVNGTPVETEIMLQDGDVILFGGTSEVSFTLDGAQKDEEEKGAAGAPGGTAAVPPNTGGETAGQGSSLMLVAGAVVGLAVIVVVVAGIVVWNGWEKKCEATARIKGPESGDVLSQTTEVLADVQQKTPCVGDVVFLLDGKEFGRAKTEPYKVTLEAQSFSDLSDGLDHKLSVVLLDAKGEPIPQVGDEIALAFETLATPTPTPEVTPVTTGPETPKTPQGKQVSGIETHEMIKNLLSKDFPGAPGYKLDTQFLAEVNKKTAEYASEGYFTRASQYKTVINVAYALENNLDPSIGYILAMSRSKFNVLKQGTEEGLWRISPQLLAENQVDLGQLCGTETLSDPAQNCSTKVSALYLKSIILNVFEGDIIYGVAVIGLSPQEAAIFRAGLPADRKDFWQIIKSPKQREEIVRFFAAGIVIENPERFGLKKDQPISKLYPPK
jgi:hypothetical protein